MKADRPKQYLPLRGKALLDISVSQILNHCRLEGCMIAIHSDDPFFEHTDASSDPGVEHCIGGEERSDSVLAALEAIGDRAQANDWVLVHDAARPCLHPDDLKNLVEKLEDHPVGGLLATPVSDTLKEVEPGSFDVRSTIDRQRLWRALTPQMFRFGLLKEALVSARRHGAAVTDESSALERMGKAPCLVEGRPDNIKVTVPADLGLAEFILDRF